MALIITDMQDPRLDSTQQYHVYCCGDSMVAREAWDVLRPMLSPEDEIVYKAGLSFQSVALTMTLRGVAVDPVARAEAIASCEKEEARLIAALRQDEELQEIWDSREEWDNKRDGFCRANPKKLSLDSNHTWTPRGALPQQQQCLHCAVSRWVVTPINPHSNPQMQHLFYDLLHMKVRHSNKPPYGITVDEEAREALALKYPEHAALLDKIGAVHKEHKQQTCLASKVDADGRWRASYNVAAAESGRMSSSRSPRRTGLNKQNIADKNRHVIVADPGLVLWYADLEQAESNVVANDAECPEDIADHNTADVHTTLCRRIWKNLDGFAWTGDLAQDKALAQQPAPWDPDHDLRHYGKIVRHMTNIAATKYGIARSAHISLEAADAMRNGYFAAYPRNLARQLEIRREVKETGELTNPLGRRRTFLGRLYDESTMKEALAQTQQSTIADMLNVAMWRIWYELDTRFNMGVAPKPADPNRVWLLAQVHDALLGLVRPGDDGTLARIKTIMETPVRIRGNLVTIRCEIALGPTWRKSDMVKWTPPADRSPSVSSAAHA